jgi:NitT/TauT family transport system ATP-binding protein
MASVSIRQLSKIYGSEDGSYLEALKNIDLDVCDHEFVSVLGPSGCGKSTLMRCVAGLEEFSSGTVLFDDKRLDGPPENLGIVFQRDLLLDWRTVLDNVILIGEFQGKRSCDLRPRAAALLERFGLGGFENRRPWELSGGMRQRAAICRALVVDPQLLLMDEPFGALDAMTRDDLNLELARIWQETRKTVLFITHSISEAIFLSDRVVVMDRSPGRIVEVVNIDLPRPRRLEIRADGRFTEYVSRIGQIFSRLGSLGARADA